MKSFFKMFGASALAYLVVGGILTVISFVAFFGILGSFASGIDGFKSQQEKVRIKKNTILKINFNKGITDNSYSEFDKSSFSMNEGFGLNSIIWTIQAAKEEDSIAGIYLNMSNFPAGKATLSEVREALEDFKTSGKFIYAYSEVYSQDAYLLASVADSIFMYPEGGMELSGLSMSVAYLKDMLDKVGVEMQVVRGSNNKFKSAVEPFLMNHMSEANRMQLKKYTGTVWNNMLVDISKSRNISINELQTIADKSLIRSGSDAVKLGLVDGLFYYDELTNFLKSKVDVEEDDKLKFIALSKYAKTIDKKKYKDAKKGNIAVIYASGEIESGKGGNSIIGSDRIAKAIRDARKDSMVQAVVLRVNSPGGSALASDVILREVNITKGEKPVVVSMGDLAASGGYYISCSANKVYAQPNSLTGSIGVFGVIPNAQKLMKEKMGINIESVNTAKNADMYSITKPLTEEQYNIIQSSVDSVYHVFKSKIVEGRNTFNHVDEVDKIGQGRIWAGTDALEIGLIDELGGFVKAINGAADLAKIAQDDIKLVTYPKPKKNDLTEILEILESLEEEQAVIETGNSKFRSDILKQVNTMETIITGSVYQARLPFVLY